MFAASLRSRWNRPRSCNYPTSQFCALFDFNCGPLRHDESPPDKTDSLNDKRKGQHLSILNSGDRSTTYIQYIWMACGQTTATSTGAGHPYQPSPNRSPESVIRLNFIMLARGISETVAPAARTTRATARAARVHASPRTAGTHARSASPPRPPLPPPRVQAPPRRAGTHARSSSRRRNPLPPAHGIHLSRAARYLRPVAYLIAGAWPVDRSIRLQRAESYKSPCTFAPCLSDLRPCRNAVGGHPDARPIPTQMQERHVTHISQPITLRCPRRSVGIYGSFYTLKRNFTAFRNRIAS